MKGKKLLAGVLSAAMVLSSMSFAALADEINNTTENDIQLMNAVGALDNVTMGFFEVDDKMIDDETGKKAEGFYLTLYGLPSETDNMEVKLYSANDLLSTTTYVKGEALASDVTVRIVTGGDADISSSWKTDLNTVDWFGKKPNKFVVKVDDNSREFEIAYENFAEENKFPNLEVAKKKVAKIGDDVYSSFDAAVKAAPAGSTVTLLSDTTGTNAIIDKDLTIDLNGYKLTMSAPDETAGAYNNIQGNVNFTSTENTVKGTIDISDISCGTAFWRVAGGKKLSFENVDLEGTNVKAGAGVIFKDDSETETAEVSFENSTVNLSANGLTTNNAKFVNNVNVTFDNTDVKVQNFDGVISRSNAVLDGESKIDTTGCSYVANKGELTLNDKASITADGCTEPAIKLGENSKVTLNGESTLDIKNTATGVKDIDFRGEVTSEEQKNSVRIKVNGTSQIKSEKINAEIFSNPTIFESENPNGIVNTSASINVKFVPTADTHKYNVVLSSENTINEFTSAQFQFANTSPVNYDVVEIENGDIVVNYQGDNVYSFNLKEGKIVNGTEIVLGTVVFEDAYGAGTFSVNTSYENKAVATKGDNLTNAFTADNLMAQLILNGADNGSISFEFKEPVCTATINVAMNETVTDNATAYQDMKIEITASGEDKQVITLGTDGKNLVNGVYTVNDVTLKQNKRYVISVSGAGYRKAEYILDTKAKTDATVNFWNNVKPVAAAMEEDNANSEVNANFVAGDIIKDNKMNIYDLSAVVSYFGTKASDADKTNGWNMVKYDLNRDGKIDSTDVSIVLNAWKALDGLDQN